MRNRVLQERRQAVRVGLGRGLHAEVDNGIEQRLHLRRAHLRQAALEEQRDAAAGHLRAVVGNDGHVVEVDVAQEAVIEVGPAVEVEDDAVVLHRHRREHHAVAGRGRLALLVEHLLVGVAAWPQIAVGHQDEIVAQRKRAMRKALLGLQVAHQLAPSALRDGGRRAARSAWDGTRWRRPPWPSFRPPRRPARAPRRSVHRPALRPADRPEDGRRTDSIDGNERPSQAPRGEEILRLPLPFFKRTLLRCGSVWIVLKDAAHRLRKCSRFAIAGQASACESWMQGAAGCWDVLGSAACWGESAPAMAGLTGWADSAACSIAMCAAGGAIVTS